MLHGMYSPTTYSISWQSRSSVMYDIDKPLNRQAILHGPQRTVEMVWAVP